MGSGECLRFLGEWECCKCMWVWFLVFKGGVVVVVRGSVVYFY